MKRAKENEGEREDGKANSSSVSSAVLREDIVNLLDLIERLKNEEDQIVLETDQIEKLKLELTFLLACLQICYYISDFSNAEMSCISYEVHDLVQSLFHQSGDDMLVKLKDHVVPRLLENIKSSKFSGHNSESSATITEDQLVQLLDALLVNLHYLPKVRAELIFLSMTQYELLQNVFGNLRDFHGLIVNGCIEHKTIEYVLPQFQLMAERVGYFCFVLLSYQLDKTDNEDEKDEDEDEDGDEKYEDHYPTFPSSLKELKLYGVDLTSDALSRIGRSLSNLQKLELFGASIQGGKEWNMEQVTFQNLKFLTLVSVSFSEWQVIADESFPVLEELRMYDCTKLKEIPESFGDIASLKLIRVWDSHQLIESALKIKEYVAEMTGEEDKLEVEVREE